MKQILTLVLITFIVFSNAQSSLNIVSGYNIGKPQVGVAFVMEDKHFVFETQVLANHKDLTGSIKSGPNIFRDGRSRLTIPLKLTSNIKTNEFKVWVSPEFTTRLGKFTISQGVDLRVKKEKSYVQSNDSYVEWNSPALKIYPFVNVQYLLYGKRIQPKKNKPTEFVGWDLNWNQFNTYATILAITNGVTEGALQAFYADAYVFEKRGWNKMFWAHNGWETKYLNNTYMNEDGSINPMKSQALGNFGRDFKHTGDDVSKFTNRYMGISMGISATLETLKTIKYCKDNKVKNKKKVIRQTIMKEVLKSSAIWLTSSLIENQIYENLRRN